MLFKNLKNYYEKNVHILMYKTLYFNNFKSDRDRFQKQPVLILEPSKYLQTKLQILNKTEKIFILNPEPFKNQKFSVSIKKKKRRHKIK